MPTHFRCTDNLLVEGTLNTQTMYVQAHTYTHTRANQINMINIVKQTHIHTSLPNKNKQTNKTVDKCKIYRTASEASEADVKVEEM